MAHRAGTDEGGEVRRHAAALHAFQILAQGGPVDVVVHIDLLAREFLLHRRVQRAHGHLAHHFERHALAQIAECAAVDEKGFFRVRQHVDEARRNRLAVRIDFRAALAGRVLADIDDAIALNRDIADIRLRARTVIDESGADDGVVGNRVRRGDTGRNDARQNDGAECPPRSAIAARGVDRE